MKSSTKRPPKPGLERSPLTEEEMSNGQLEQLRSDCVELEDMIDDARGYTRSGLSAGTYTFEEKSALKIFHGNGYFLKRMYIVDQSLRLRRESKEVKPEKVAILTAEIMEYIVSLRDEAYSDIRALNANLTRLGVPAASFLRPTHSVEFETAKFPNAHLRPATQKGAEYLGDESDRLSNEEGAKPWLNSANKTIKAGESTYYRGNYAGALMNLKGFTPKQRDVALLRIGYGIKSDIVIGGLLGCSRKSVYDRMKGVNAKLKNSSMGEEFKRLIEPSRAMKH